MCLTPFWGSTKQNPLRHQHLSTTWYPSLGQGTCGRKTNQWAGAARWHHLLWPKRWAVEWRTWRPLPWTFQESPWPHPFIWPPGKKEKASPSVNKSLPGPHWSPGLLSPTQISFPSAAPFRVGCSIPQQSHLLHPGSHWSSVNICPCTHGGATL